MPLCDWTGLGERVQALAHSLSQMAAHVALMSLPDCFVLISNCSLCLSLLAGKRNPAEDLHY